MQKVFVKHRPLIIRRWPGMNFGKAGSVERHKNSYKLYFDDGVNLTDVCNELRSVPAVLYVGNPEAKRIELEDGAAPDE